jgi:hypothetical protein
MDRPPDANPNVPSGPPQAPPTNELPRYDGVMGYDASPYMFQMGPRMLGSDGPVFSNDAGMAPRSPAWAMTGRRAPGWWAPLLAQYGINIGGRGPGGLLTFNAPGGRSFFSTLGGHEGAGPGPQSDFIQQLLGGQANRAHYGPQFDPRVRALDQAMAAASQGSVNQAVRALTPADKARMAATGTDIFGGSAMGTKLPTVTRAPGFKSGMAPKAPGLPPQAPLPTEGNQAGGKQVAAGGNPDTSTANRGGQTPNIKINVGQKPPAAPTTYDGCDMGHDSLDPTMPNKAGGPATTDQGGGVAGLIMQLLTGGGDGGPGAAMPSLDLMRRRRPMGFDGSDFGQNRMKDWGMRSGSMPSPY